MRLDGTIFVTDAHRTDADALDAASELLRDNGCPLIGAIENRVANSPKTSHAETH
jgi:Mrp family chromosome partitioning ATPase